MASDLSDRLRAIHAPSLVIAGLQRFVHATLPSTGGGGWAI